jgi:hypothetical protein
VLTYYGAEAFGLRVIGRPAVQSGDAGLLDLARQVRFGPGVLLAVGCLWLAAGLWIRRAAVPLTAEQLAPAVPAPRAPYWDGAG